MATDTLRLDTPAGQDELKFLSEIKVGESRKSVFLPALDVKVAWVCVKAEPQTWQFEGRFCGLPLFVMEIDLLKTVLSMTVVTL